MNLRELAGDWKRRLAQRYEWLAEQDGCALRSITRPARAE